MRYHVIFNPRSGTAMNLGLDHEALAICFARHGLKADIDATDDRMMAKVERAISSDADAIVCAGGDGTFTAVARALKTTDKPLTLLPLGTANLLARDLGFPLDLENALHALAEARMVEIDAGEINGRLFLHKVVIGSIPAIAAVREKVRGGGALASLRFASYVYRRLTDARRVAVAITSRDTVDRIERVHAIAVANNAYDEGWGKVFRRSSLTDGSLTLYILHRLNVGDVIRLALEMIAGRWQDDAGVTIETVQSVSLRTKKQRVAAMIDGEVEILESPLKFRIRPKALRVLVPHGGGPPAKDQDTSNANRASLGLALRPS